MASASRIGICILMISVTICLLAVVLSTPVIRAIDLVHQNVTVGEVNGTLSLGTLGYCLKVSANVSCSTPKFLYTINDNQVLAQVKMGSTITRGITLGNLVAAVGALFTSIFVYWAGSSKGLRMTVVIFAGIGAFAGSIGFIFDIIFITNSLGGLHSAGIGFWLTGFAIVVLLGFAGIVGFLCKEAAVKEDEVGPVA